MLTYIHVLSSTRNLFSDGASISSQPEPLLTGFSYVFFFIRSRGFSSRAFFNVDGIQFSSWTMREMLLPTHHGPNRLLRPAHRYGATLLGGPLGRAWKCAAGL
jgi:hypothetical protein